MNFLRKFKRRLVEFKNMWFFFWQYFPISSKISKFFLSPGHLLVFSLIFSNFSLIFTVFPCFSSRNPHDDFSLFKNLAISISPVHLLYLLSVFERYDTDFKAIWLIFVRKMCQFCQNCFLLKSRLDNLKILTNWLK